MVVPLNSRIEINKEEEEGAGVPPQSPLARWRGARPGRVVSSGATLPSPAASNRTV